MAASDCAGLDGSETGAMFPQAGEHRESTAQQPLDEAAVRLARLGWSVFRVRPGGKRPLALGWQEEASANPAEVAKQWRLTPRANLGVVTGHTFWALDVDGAEGRAALAVLEMRHGPLPPTPTSLTGGGGEHRFFASPPSRTIRNSCRRLGPGLDTRGMGGFVVTSPSVHPSGRIYAWRSGHEPWSMPLASAPAWLVDLAEPSRPPTRPTIVPPRSPICSAYANAALRRAVERVARAAPGTRNSTLNVETWCLARLAASGVLSVEAVAIALASAALATGLSVHEVERTLASALRAGLAAAWEPRP